MDWETLSCPHRPGRGYGKPFSQGYWVKNSTSRGQPRVWCTACAARVGLSDGTAYDGLEADPVVGETAVRALAEGNARRATARLVHVDKETVCPWLHRVACHCRTGMRSVWHDRHVSACPRDAWWSCGPTKAAPLPGAQRDGDPAGDAWGWSAFAPVWRVGLAGVIGKRDPTGAAWWLARGAHVTDAAMPLCTSAPWPAYRPAWLHTYGAWDSPPRQGRRGASPTPQRRPPAGLRSAQVVKRRKGGRILEVRPRMVFGTPEAVAASWAHAPLRATVTTRFVERDHLTQRQRKRR